MEGGRQSGGACWRATPRNTRLDSSRTIDGRRRPCARKEKHIGPIDPDASTLKQFLKSLALRATADVLVDGGAVRLRSLRTAAPTEHRPGHKPDRRAGRPRT